jgi:hypothetical protein
VHPCGEDWGTMAPGGEGRLVSIPPPVRLVLGACLLAALFAATLLGTAAQPASAAKPCWERVVDDWYRDGVINGNYPRRCYSEALKNIPNDVKDYGSFEEDVKSALLRRARVLQISPGDSANDRDAGGGPSEGPFKEAFDRTAPRNADSIPIPLLVLGGLALALVAAGAGGLLRRRLRARRAST